MRGGKNGGRLIPPTMGGHSREGPLQRRSVISPIRGIDSDQGNGHGDAGPVGVAAKGSRAEKQRFEG